MSAKTAPRKTITAGKKAATRAVTKRTSTTKKTAAKPAVIKAGKIDKQKKVKKAKLVRDSFTMPEGEYSLIANLKERCLNAGIYAKKSEILRAAILNLAKLSDASLTAAIRKLDIIKTGRPAKSTK